MIDQVWLAFASEILDFRTLTMLPPFPLKLFTIKVFIYQRGLDYISVHFGTLWCGVNIENFAFTHILAEMQLIAG